MLLCDEQGNGATETQFMFPVKLNGFKKNVEIANSSWKMLE